MSDSSSEDEIAIQPKRRLVQRLSSSTDEEDQAQVVQYVEGGVCCIYSCQADVYSASNSHTCKEHSDMVYTGRNQMANELKIKCSFDVECTNYVKINKRFCHPHLNNTENDLQRAMMTEEEVHIESKRLIATHCPQLLLQRKNIYFGCTSQEKTRSYHHKSDKCDFKVIFEAVNKEEGFMMERAIIHNAVFHEDIEMRKAVANCCGASKFSKAVDDVKFFIYISTSGEGQKPSTNSGTRFFQEGNASPDESSRIANLIIVNKLREIVGNRVFRIGLTLKFKERMAHYNGINYIYHLMEYEDVNDCDRFILAKTGMRFVVNNRRVTLTGFDVRKMELMLISKLSCLEFAGEFRAQLSNKGLGGDHQLHIGRNDMAFVYVRLAHPNVRLADFQLAESTPNTEFYEGEVFYMDNGHGGIDWVGNCHMNLLLMNWVCARSYHSLRELIVSI